MVTIVMVWLYVVSVVLFATTILLFLYVLLAALRAHNGKRTSLSGKPQQRAAQARRGMDDLSEDFWDELLKTQGGQVNAKTHR
ncbi:MAG: hypothetical protein IT328_23780 [Caldilineaceae bacterium]|nr:hypothetical protein [Caldilineaceae bacterium]